MAVKLPTTSVVILTQDNAADIGFTIESLLSQELLPLEILIIDAHSTDHLPEIIHSFRSDLIKILSVSNYMPAEMRNRAIVASRGDYLNFLEPGSCYLFQGALKWMMAWAEKNGRPGAVSGQALKRVKGEDPKLDSQSVEACWFLKTALKERNFELFMEGHVSTSRVVVDTQIKKEGKRLPL